MRDVNGRTKVRVRLGRARLGDLGDHEPVDEGVRELRIDYGPGYRVYFAKEGNRLILLLIGGEGAPEQGESLSHFIASWQSRDPHLVQSVAWCWIASECDAGTGDNVNALSDV